MITRAHLIAAACAVVLTALALGASVAQAGTYTVYSCHTPSGRAVGTDGWTAQNTIGEATSITSSNQCSEFEGGLNAQLIGNGGLRRFYHDSAGWVFRAPEGISITGFRAAVCGLPVGAGEGIVVSWPEETFPSPQGLDVLYPGVMGCSGTRAQWQSSGNWISGVAISTPALWFSVICTTYATCETDGVGYGGFLGIHAFAAALEDPSPPAVSAVSGPLAGNATHQGTETVTFNATDQGSGVYRAVAEAKINGSGEWRMLTSQIVDTNGGRCVPEGETASPYEFDTVAPCRASVQGATLALDTSQLPPGNQLLRVVVEDASGNRTDVIAPRVFHVDGAPDAITNSAARLAPTEPPAVNGLHASRTALLHLNGPRARRIGYGRRVTVGGRLLDAHSHPIANAAVQVESRTFVPKTAIAGEAWQTIGQVTTTKTGAFSARLPAGDSRNVLFVYKANAEDAGWTSTAQVDVIVSAHVNLRVKDAVVHNHHSAVFSGQIAGRVPPAGVLVTLQVKEGDEWIPVATNHQPARSDSRGRFALAYRFERTYRPATFLFRVLANQDSDFAFDEGYSKPVKLHVLP